MVSYIQVEGYGLEQGFKGVVKPASGRPKAQSLQQEDAYFWYEYDSRGGLKGKTPKTAISQYAYWHKHNVKFGENYRLTPLTEFEKRLGVSMATNPITTVWYSGLNENNQRFHRKFTDAEWTIYKQTHEIDHGNVEYYYSSDLPTQGRQQREVSWNQYFIDKAEKQDLIIVGEADSKLANVVHLNFKEKPIQFIEDKIPRESRPNPKDKCLVCWKDPPRTDVCIDCCNTKNHPKCKKPEPIETASKEVEPIKEVAKYSPLMIAGVIAVVVILFLRRRA